MLDGEAAKLEKLIDEAKSEPMAENVGKSYHRGISTALDVRRLTDGIKIVEGEEITHEQIEGIICESRKSQRYRTVVSKWKKFLMAGQNILLMPRSGIGYIAAMPGERIAVADGLRRQATTRIVKAVDIAVRTDKKRLTDSQRRQLDFITATSSRLSLLEAAQNMGDNPAS